MLLVLQISRKKYYSLVCMELWEHSMTSSISSLNLEFIFTLDTQKCISYADFSTRPKMCTSQQLNISCVPCERQFNNSEAIIVIWEFCITASSQCLHINHLPMNVQCYLFWVLKKIASHAHMHFHPLGNSEAGIVHLLMKQTRR